MRFSPKSEDELNKLLEPGQYDFEIADATDEISKSSGKDMIKLKILIYHGEDSVACIFDYLMESVAYKLRHCCDSVGLLEKYNTGELTADMLIGKCGRAIVVIQKDKSGQYPDKNAVKDYVKRLPVTNAKVKEVINGLNNGVYEKNLGDTKDDLPF